MGVEQGRAAVGGAPDAEFAVREQRTGRAGGFWSNSSMCLSPECSTRKGSTGTQEAEPRCRTGVLGQRGGEQQGRP